MGESMDGVKARMIGSLLKWHGLDSGTNVRESTKVDSLGPELLFLINSEHGLRIDLLKK